MEPAAPAFGNQSPDSCLPPSLGSRILNEKGGIGFSTTGGACVDFFSKIVRSTSVETALDYFVKAWNEEPDTALKALFNLRDIREGKGEKKLPLVITYAFSCWKPETFKANLDLFLGHGCYKDLLILAELAHRCKDTEYFARTTEDDRKIELKIFATQLKKDLEALDASEKAGISLAAKWAPTEGQHFDHAPLRFAKEIQAFAGFKDMKEYRKVLTRLRGQLRVLEQMMCNGRWEEIEFSKIPAKAHRLYRKAFSREKNAADLWSPARLALKDRYVEYLAKLSKGEEKIKATGTHPHELVTPYAKDYGEVELDETLEGQWRALVQNLRESGNFSRTQAVVDVSGSMEGTPMLVAISLGLIVAELTEEPFKNKLITFHEKPSLHTVQGTTLMDRVKDVKAMEWGGTTNFLSVFKLLLKEAKKNPGCQMVEKLIVFSDMQFDQAAGYGYGRRYGHYGSSSDSESDSESVPVDQKTGDPWASTYEIICKMYAKAGFTVPQIIFWNLRDTRAGPVEQSTPGTALISGFSANMMKSFLEAKMVEFNPTDVMYEALSKYQIAAIPDAEKNPFPVDFEWTKSIGKFEEVVEKHLVPKKVVRRKRKMVSRSGTREEEPESDVEDSEKSQWDSCADANDLQNGLEESSLD